jgi:hypothetical protein
MMKVPAGIEHRSIRFISQNDTEGKYQSKAESKDKSRLSHPARQ